jgi:hypothetical protein
MADSSTKRGLEQQLESAAEKKSPDHKKAKKDKKEKKEKKDKKSKQEKRAEEAEHWRSQVSNTPHRPHTENLFQTSPARKETVRTHSEARSLVSRASTTTETYTGDQRLRAAEQDINDLWNDTSILFSGMKQIQKQQAYLMQRDAAQARKEASTQAIITNWPPHTKEQDRDRIIEWLVGRANIPNREFVHASHRLQEEAMSRITILHFRSVWSTKKFLETMKKVASGRNPLPYWEENNTVPQDSNGRPFHLQIRQQICTPDRIKSIPLKAFLQVINDTASCTYHNQTHNMYKNWAAHVFSNDEGNLLKCVFNDTEGTLKMLIREDLFNMVEDGIEAAWKKVMNRPSDEEFANRKGKGGGKGKSTPTRQERGIQDYLYKVYLVKAHPTHEEEMDP